MMPAIRPRTTRTPAAIRYGRYTLSGGPEADGRGGGGGLRGVPDKTAASRVRSSVATPRGPTETGAAGWTLVATAAGAAGASVASATGWDSARAPGWWTSFPPS